MVLFSRQTPALQTYSIKKYFAFLAVLTAIYLLCYWLTPVNDFITLKAVSMVMIALGWCVLPVSYLFWSSVIFGRADNSGNL